MNPEHLSRGWALIAEGAQYISLAYAAIDPPLARSGVPESLPAAEAPEAGVPPASVSGPSFDELPPTGFPVANGFPPGYEPTTPEPSEPALKPQVEAGLGKCPVHGKPWTVKAAGVGKNGPFDAFWRCAEKDDKDWCKQKPQKIWRDLHPIPGSAAA